MPCITVPLNYLETGGTGFFAFDFLKRPVGGFRSLRPRDLYAYGSRNLVSNHEHGRVKLKLF